MIHFSRIRLATVAVLQAAAPSAKVLWAPARQPERAQGGSVLAAKLPTARMVGFCTFEQSEPTLVRWTATAISTGAVVGIDVTGARWTVAGQGGDTLTDVRDRLLAALVPATELPGVSTSAFGSDSIDFSASGVVGRLWRPVAIGASAVTVTTDANARVTTGTVRGELEIQAYADGRGLEAQELLGDVVSGLASPDVVEARQRWGISFPGRAGDIIDLTTLAGADWQSRASVRVPVAARAYRAVSLLPITEVHYSGELNPGTFSGVAS